MKNVNLDNAYNFSVNDTSLLDCTINIDLDLTEKKLKNKLM